MLFRKIKKYHFCAKYQDDTTGIIIYFDGILATNLKMEKDYDKIKKQIGERFPNKPDKFILLSLSLV